MKWAIQINIDGLAWDYLTENIFSPIQDVDNHLISSDIDKAATFSDHKSALDIAATFDWETRVIEVPDMPKLIKGLVDL